ncbi:hypothetical protein S7335_3556 [Synechococcus sp. PCC 7335]|uniref:hypothetical protein n=1 Tax=Synechococcus sp. (strain ATCC 29403 / PCC 7335) TaxID=91464 RepID=UPI00017EB05B|nr:hypothetical protein [Synechococcus sp. PCC 7335]EDX85853.1 hypothetical protein S7335_3556 [Synechococcus sp. PCC 7335]
MVSATVFEPSVQPYKKLSHRDLPGYQSDADLSSAPRQSSQLVIQSAQAHRSANLSRLARQTKEGSILAAKIPPVGMPATSTAKLAQPRDTLAKSHLTQLPRQAHKDQLVKHSPVSTPIKLPRQPRLPSGLKLLRQIQQGSTVLAGLLVAGALVVYGSSAYTNRSTNQAQARLNALQSESQQLTIANESIRQSLAEQAIEENSGLEPYQPDDLLFITPEPQRAKINSEEKGQKWLQPLGY